MEYLVIGLLSGWILSEIGEYKIRQNYNRQLKSANEHSAFLLKVILEKKVCGGKKCKKTKGKLPMADVSKSLPSDIEVLCVVRIINE